MHTNSRLRALLTCLALAGLVTGCRSKAPPKAAKAHVHIRVGLQDEPKTIDPTLFFESAGHQIVMNTYKGLVDYDQRTLQVIPAVAELPDISPDGLVYTFHLRNDAYFWGGDLTKPVPVTAYDFEYAWRRLLDPTNEAQYITALQDMGVAGTDEYFAHVKQYNTLVEQKKVAEAAGSADKAKALQAQMDAVLVGLTAQRLTLGFRAVANHVFEVRLKDKSRGRLFMKYLPLSFLAPVHQLTIAKWGKEWTKPEHYVVNGPYLVVAHAQGATWELVKNPHYWNAGKVTIDDITFVVSTDSNVLLRSYQSRNPADTLQWLGAATQLPAERIKEWEHKPDYRFSTLLTSYFLEFHVRRSPLDNLLLRQALCYAVDRQELVEKVTKAGQVPSRGWIPTVTGEYQEITDGFKFDPAKARALLAQAGYGDRHPVPPVTYTFNSSPRHQAVAEAVQAMWQRELGLKVELANQEWASFLDARIQDALQLARGGWQGDCADPYTFAMVQLSDSDHNYGKWVNPRYDELVYAARDSADPAERQRLYEQADRLIVEEVPVCPLFVDAHPNLVKPEVQGFYSNVLDYHPIDQLSIATVNPNQAKPRQ